MNRLSPLPWLYNNNYNSEPRDSDNPRSSRNNSHSRYANEDIESIQPVNKRPYSDTRKNLKQRANRRSHPHKKLRAVKNFDDENLYAKANGINKFSNNPRLTYRQTQQKRIWRSIRYKAKEIKKIIPSVRDINIIDKYSRLMFPSLFLLFNVYYWCNYLIFIH